MQSEKVHYAKQRDYNERSNIYKRAFSNVTGIVMPFGFKKDLLKRIEKDKLHVAFYKKGAWFHEI